MGGRREETHGNREEKFRPQGTRVPGEGPTWAVTSVTTHSSILAGEDGLLALWLLVKCVPTILGSTGGFLEGIIYRACSWETPG